ncbi:hypothetical protein M569_06008 [Genlisea aurea]|uniref:HORMA domain-containing protein n=1 Tax=Genlisea aurea TaxID=192259 RepID=S8CNJ9_9LAMI|nr:hypothetical protein M569_06008 [Genlisea aurea]
MVSGVSRRKMLVVAQKVKEAEITEQDSLLLTRNLLRIAIFNISYIRGLFPEKYFIDKSVPALDMKIKKLMPLDAESRRLIDWMEKGVYDALQKKYLKTLLFCICEGVGGPTIEEYTCKIASSPNDLSSACKMVRTLIQLMRTLDKMPEEAGFMKLRVVLMKLLYYDDITPTDYEPPFFKGCSEEEALNPWTKNPLKMEVGKVNSKHFVLALKVKSVLDPCEDENNGIQDDVRSLGGAADSLQKDELTESESESVEIQKTMLPSRMDPEEDEQQLRRVRDWISSQHFDFLELADVLSNFPNVSTIRIEEIMDVLVKEGYISKATDNKYIINRKKSLEYEFDAVKDEVDGQKAANDGKFGNKSPDYMYMKALYHTLPLNHITAAELHKKLAGEASLKVIRKLIDKMVEDGYVQHGNNRRIGKRVVHSDLTEQKLIAVKKYLKTDGMCLDAKESANKPNFGETNAAPAYNPKDLSTCGGLHSIGSDVTRTRGRSDAVVCDSTRSENGVGAVRGMELAAGGTPTSRIEVARIDDGGRGNGNTTHVDDMEVMDSAPSQDKRSRKASMVKDAILQYAKRQKFQAF